MGDEVNAIHSALIRIHYIALDRAIHLSFSEETATMGEKINKKKKEGRGKNQYSHQISLATVNNSFRQEYCNEEMVVRRQRFGGVSTRMVGGRAKRQKEITHTHTHTHKHERDRCGLPRAASNCS